MVTHLFHLDPHLQFFQFSLSAQLTIFSRVLNFRSRFGNVMIQVDIGGHPPIPFEMPPSILSVFQFQHNLQFFAVFQVLNFRSRFEALNDVFLGKAGATWVNGSIFLTPKFVLLRYTFLTRYGACQTEIVCQSYVPGKLKHQFTQTGSIVLALHLLGLGFWMFKFFRCFSIINRPSSLIVTQFRGL